MVNQENCRTTKAIPAEGTGIDGQLSIVNEQVSVRIIIVSYYLATLKESAEYQVIKRIKHVVYSIKQTLRGILNIVHFNPCVASQVSNYAVTSDL